MEKKYEITNETIVVDGHTLHRIKALRDFSDVKSSDVGGWIESEDNLSHDGNSWVYGNAKVYGYAEVYGEAEVCGNAIVESNNNYAAYKNSWSSGRYFTYTRSNKMWKVGCFYGTGEELISKAYKDGELSGRCYEAIVRAQEAIDRAIEESAVK